VLLNIVALECYAMRKMKSLSLQLIIAAGYYLLRLSANIMVIKNLNPRLSSRHPHRRFLTGGILALICFLPTCAMSISDEITPSLELTPNIENGKKNLSLMCKLPHGQRLGKEGRQFSGNRRSAP
jgi:hypothetical protein